LTRATGLPITSVALTSQSRAFFKEPGTPWAYSGDEMTIPSAASIWARKL
jgi:hypothetical protein